MNALPQLRLAATSSFPKAQNVWSRLVAAFESPWVAYTLIFILQLKIVWAMWAYREVTVGDTNSYYTLGWHWYTSWLVNAAWSPAYTAFYGTFNYLSADPVWITQAHRLVIVLAATLLVLAVLRQLLPPSVAWLCAAWWSVLPIVFNTLYEVHLFSVIPIVLVWLLLLTARGPWRRAAALALLGASAVLVRNELSVPVGVLATFLLVWEWKAAAFQPAGRPAGLRRAALAYAVCAVAAVALVVGVYERSYIQEPELSVKLREKHTLNMAQVYAFGYQQRHPEWTANPWLECCELMKEHFGQPTPSLREMIVANPRAVGEHFAWNLSLAPSGLQLLLFNRATGKVSPDYDYDVVRRMNNSKAWILTTALLAIWALGGYALWRNRKQWWSEWLRARVLGWVGLFAVAAVVPLVIATQRPRPSYLFAFAVLLIAISGMCGYALLARWRLMERFRQIVPLVMVALILFTPRFFTKAYASVHPDYVGKATQRLAKYRQELSRPHANLLVPCQPIGMYAQPTIRILCPFDQYFYTDELIITSPDAPGVLYDFPETLKNLKPGETLLAGLARFGITYVYLDEFAVATIQSLPSCGGAEAFVAAQDTSGWRLLDHGDAPGDRWRLYRRE